MAEVEEGQVIGVHTVDEWKLQLQNAKDSKKLVSNKTSSFAFCTFLV